METIALVVFLACFFGLTCAFLNLSIQFDKFMDMVDKDFLLFLKEFRSFRDWKG